MSRGVGDGRGSKFACIPCFTANHCAHCLKHLRCSVVSYGEPSGKPGYICTPCMDKYAKDQESLHGRGAPLTPEGHDAITELRTTIDTL